MPVESHESPHPQYTICTHFSLLQSWSERALERRWRRKRTKKGEGLACGHMAGEPRAGAQTGPQTTPTHRQGFLSTLWCSSTSHLSLLPCFPTTQVELCGHAPAQSLQWLPMEGSGLSSLPITAFSVRVSNLTSRPHHLSIPVPACYFWNASLAPTRPLSSFSRKAPRHPHPSGLPSL